MTDEPEKFGDTLIKGAFARLDKVIIPEGEEFAGNYAVTFSHSDGTFSVLMMSDDPTPCDVFIAGAYFMHKKINRWVEKGEIVLA